MKWLNTVQSVEAREALLETQMGLMSTHMKSRLICLLRSKWVSSRLSCSLINGRTRSMLIQSHKRSFSTPFLTSSNISWSSTRSIWTPSSQSCTSLCLRLKLILVALRPLSAQKRSAEPQQRTLTILLWQSRSPSGKILSSLIKKPSEFSSNSSRTI